MSKSCSCHNFPQWCPVHLTNGGKSVIDQDKKTSRAVIETLIAALKTSDPILQARAIQIGKDYLDLLTDEAIYLEMKGISDKMKEG